MDQGAAEFFCQTSERMEQAADGSVALTVTSPPYWNAIDYDVHAGGSDGWYTAPASTPDGFGDYSGYLDLMRRIFSEVLRVTKPGGFCAVVIGTVLIKGRHMPVPFDLLSRLCSAGWQFHQDIIWHKTTAGVRRAGVAIQKPYPGYYYPNIMTEYIMVFRKPGEPIYRQADGAKEESRFPIDDLFKLDVANNIWHIAPVPPHHLEHPCPFPKRSRTAWSGCTRTGGIWYWTRSAARGRRPRSQQPLGGAASTSTPSGRTSTTPGRACPSRCGCVKSSLSQGLKRSRRTPGGGRREGACSGLGNRGRRR